MINYIDIKKERKIINGKLYARYFIDSQGNEVGIPTGVYINSSMSSIRYRHSLRNPFKIKKGFLYHDKESQEKALHDMIKLIHSCLGENIQTVRNKDIHKKITKKYYENVHFPELPIGLNLSMDFRGRVQLSVSVFDPIKNRFASKKLYVGYKDTWLDRVNNVIEKALGMRQQSLALLKDVTN